MRYTKGAPNTVYLVVNTSTGQTYSINTSLREARVSLRGWAAEDETPSDLRIATYDQRR